jgi:hypothetical protein
MTTTKTLSVDGRKRAGLRPLFWSRNVVTKSDSTKEVERAQAQTAAGPLEIENLAAIIQDFKMVLLGFNSLLSDGAGEVLRGSFMSLSL